MIPISFKKAQMDLLGPVLCATCRGTGTVKEGFPKQRGGMYWTAKTCPTCRGTGKRVGLSEGK